MITITDAQVVFDEIRKHPIGRRLEVGLIGFAGGAVGTLTLTRPSELARWVYEGPLKMPHSTHAKELRSHSVSSSAGGRALERVIRAELGGKARSVELLNPRLDGMDAVFDSKITFETSFYVLCRVQGTPSCQLHAGPFRLDVDAANLAALRDHDRDVRREALKTVLQGNSEHPLYADEILTAGGSTETYNLDQLRLAVLAEPLIFDEEAEQYVTS